MNAESSSDERIVRLIKTIVLCRHGKAVKLIPTDHDDDRQLNDLGRAQSMKLGQKLKRFQFDKILSSPLPRVRGTLVIATSGQSQIVSVPQLACTTGDGNPIDVMWNELGNVPLYHYLQHRLADGLRLWATTALNAVLDTVDTPQATKRTILVGGHALLQNALAKQITNHLGWPDWSSSNANSMVVEEILGEGECFVFTLDQTGKNKQIIAEHIRSD